MRIIPKKKYRDKVRVRLLEAQPLLADTERLAVLVELAFFADQEKLARMMRRTKSVRQPGQPTDKQAVLNQVEHLRMLLQQDVPALLDALDDLALVSSED